MTSAQSPLDVPMLDSTKFDGRFEQCWKFMNHLEDFTKSTISDLSQTNGVYKLATKTSKGGCCACPNLEAAHKHATVKKLLRGLFRKPFKVARNLLDGLLSGARRIKKTFSQVGAGDKDAKLFYSLGSLGLQIWSGSDEQFERCHPLPAIAFTKPMGKSWSHRL